MTTLIHFDGKNGRNPQAALVFDKSERDLYGTTSQGGNVHSCVDAVHELRGCGTVFKLEPPSVGKTAWAVMTIARFNFRNGANPVGGVIFDNIGNLYGTAAYNYCGDCTENGTIFQLLRPAAGDTEWTLKTIINLDGTESAGPLAGLVIDRSGNLYGTTYTGGSGDGTVFEIENK